MVLETIGVISFAIAGAVAANTVLPVSTVLNGEYGISDVALSTLCILGNEGVVTTLTPKLSDDELEKMRNSAEVLKGVIAQIEI